MLLCLIGVNSLAAENAMQTNNSTLLWLTNRGSASDYWFGDKKIWTGDQYRNQGHSEHSCAWTKSVGA